MDDRTVYVTMPKELPTGLLKAVRQDPLTSCEDRDEMNTRIGWLLCAWDVLIAAQAFALQENRDV